MQARAAWRTLGSMIAPALGKICRMRGRRRRRTTGSCCDGSVLPTPLICPSPHIGASQAIPDPSGSGPCVCVFGYRS